MSSDNERGSVARPALSRLISMPSRRFADDYWGSQPQLSRAAGLEQGFADLFSLSAADELVADRGIRTPFVRMATEGTLLDPSRYTGTGGFGAEVGDQLDSGKVLAEFGAGATLVLQGLHRTWQPLAEFSRQLVSDLGHPVQINAYVTPASSRGFDPHYDVHDVFVIQIHGEKRWSIHPPVLQHPLRTQPWTDHPDAVAARAAEVATIDETFAPGDVLYLPRGWIHSATALGGISIHLTIGIAAITRWDIVQQLINRAATNSGLRASLPLGIDLAEPDSLDPIVRETIDELSKTLARSETSFLSNRLAQRLADATRPEPVSPLATIEALGEPDRGGIVSWRRSLWSRIEQDADSVRIVLATRTITLPVEAAKAVTTLARGDEAGVSELAGLDAESSVVVSRRLIREGVLVIR